MRLPRCCSILVSACALPVMARAQAPDAAAPRLTLPAAERAATLQGYERALTGPALTATADDVRLRLLVARAARDTALVRAALREADDAHTRLGARNAPPPFLLAEAEAWLGDSAAARARMRAFDTRRDSMDARVRWDDVPNGALLARADSVRQHLDAPSAAADPGRVALPARRAGTWRWRYDAVIWTRLPFATPIDTAVPVARLALVVDETVAPEGDALTLRTAIRGAAFESPLLAGLGDAGLAYLRPFLAALRAGALVARITSDGRLDGIRTARDADTDPGAAAATSLVLAMGPLAFAPRLPGQLAVGTSWTDTVRVAAPGTALGDAPVALPAILRLTAVREHEGRTLAVVAVDAAIVGRPLGRGPETADITLSGEFVLDAGDGLPVRTAASLRASVRDGRGARTPVRALVTALRQPAPAGEGQTASR